MAVAVVLCVVRVFVVVLFQYSTIAACNARALNTQHPARICIYVTYHHIQYSWVAGCPHLRDQTGPQLRGLAWFDSSQQAAAIDNDGKCDASLLLLPIASVLRRWINMFVLRKLIWLRMHLPLLNHTIRALLLHVRRHIKSQFLKIILVRFQTKENDFALSAACALAGL